MTTSTRSFLTAVGMLALGHRPDRIHPLDEKTAAVFTYTTSEAIEAMKALTLAKARLSAELAKALNDRRGMSTPRLGGRA